MKPDCEQSRPVLSEALASWGPSLDLIAFSQLLRHDQTLFAMVHVFDCPEAACRELYATLEPRLRQNPYYILEVVRLLFAERYWPKSLNDRVRQFPRGIPPLPVEGDPSTEDLT